MKIDFMADVHAICSDLLAANGIRLKHQDDPLLDLYILQKSCESDAKGNL